MLKTRPKTLRPPFKTHGGKNYLCHWIRGHFPKGFEAMTYVEAFAGGGSVLLNKPPSASEHLNDVDVNVMSVWWALKYHLGRFVDEARRWAYCRDSFRRLGELAGSLPDSPDCTMERAVSEYALRRMSRGGMKKAFGWSKRLRGGKPGDLNAWDTMFDALPLIHDRLRGVTLYNTSWEEVLRDHDNPDAFLYMDPPYMKGTRSKNSGRVYDHEMSDNDHKNLLDACNASKSKVLISGYQSNLYAQALKHWSFKYRPIANHSSQAARKQIKLEGLWFNY